MRLIFIITLYLSVVFSKFPSPFPRECRLAGAFDVCKGSDCPPCWVPKNGGWDCYEYKSGKQCPFFAEDASEELAKLGSSEPSATPIEPSRPSTSESSKPAADPTESKPDSSKSDNSGPTSLPESDSQSPSRSYRSTTTYIVKVVVSSALSPTLLSMSSSISYLIVLSITLSII